MDELVNSVEKMTNNVPSLTLQRYVLKKNGYIYSPFFQRDFDVIENKLIFCNVINILYCILINQF